jgi:AraC-like DNA-binding protein
MTGGRAHAAQPWARDDATWDGHAAAVHRARMFIARNLTEPVSLDDVARAAGLSRSHLCRVFRDLTGVPVHAFLNDLRLREAIWRLPDYERRLGELGVELGFHSASHFATAFRSRFGMPPRSFATKLRGDPGCLRPTGR